jgi:transcriptional regulator with XRE-family HTH domain
MSGRAHDLLVIPDLFWQRDETLAALRGRDIGRLFQLVSQYTGASQTQLGIACGTSQGKVSDIMRGVQKVESLAVFERIADALAMPDPARIILGLAPRQPAPHPGAAQRTGRTITPADTRPALHAACVSGLLNLGQQDEQEDDDPVRRRTFVGLTGATLFSAMLAGSSRGPRIDAEPFAPVLAAHIADTTPGTLDAPPDLAVLTAAVDQARSQYQACHYTDLIKHLPGLLARLHDACLALDGDDRLRAYTLSADAHHVAAGLLLKLDDQGLAYLAADRSMRAAQASEDPVTVGASARIITHTLMNGHHLGTAIATASTHAAALDRDIGAHTPESLSVYGSLLLRGAIAAAQHDKRGTAHELLSEAEDAAQRLGADGNLRWTAFGPSNATLHRVNIAVTLGDAGTAVDVARGVDLSTITVPERKASLLIDTARAFLQWDKPDKAYIVLRAAEQTAHEEVAGRPSVHRLVRQLVTAAPPALRRDAEQFAAQIGAAP